MKVVFLLLTGLLFTFAGCSKKSADQLWQEADEASKQKNHHVALERLEELVKEYAATPKAEEAHYRIAIIYNNDLREYPKAVAAYQHFASTYPENKEAPNALFLAAFLLNNELHKLDEARQSYEAFIQKYPTSELVASATFELETMGKDPSFLLQKAGEEESAAGEQGTRGADAAQ